MAEALTEDRIGDAATSLKEGDRDPQDRAGNVRYLLSDGYSPAEASTAAAAYGNAAAKWRPTPMSFDFDAVPDPPDWIVHGVIERGTVAMLSGDTGAAKSIVTMWLAVMALKGSEWLNCSTRAARVLVIDEENPGGLVAARLRAMGLVNDERAGLRYFSREGFSLGTDDGDAALVEQLRDFRPDLVVIDTLMSTTAVDVNDNVAAVATMKRLRALAREHACAVLLLHHERKQQKDGAAAGSSQQTMGARQWAGQADALLTIATETDMQREELDAGGFKLRRTFRMRLAEKDRDGRVNGVRRVAVESEKDDSERLVWMKVADEGAISNATAKDADTLAILTALDAVEGGAAIGRKDIAAATGEKDPAEPSGTWKKALKEQAEAGNVEKDGQRYRITNDGRAYLLSLRATEMAL
jgi:hypothetical protein